jgi:glycosyltransferase involved in cell wall biosynthesis
MVVVGDLSGSGGAERHFSDLHEHLRRTGSGTFVLVTASASLRRLREAGRLQTSDGVIALPLGEAPGRTRAAIAWATLALVWATLGRGFDVVHICLPTPTYVPYAALVTRLPRALRPAVVLTVLDCTLAHNLATGTAADLYEQQVVDAHRMYFRWARLDGIYTWYRAFVDAARSLHLVSARAVLSAARYCFTDPSKFRPARKSPTVVYAGRLSVQKRPLLFVDAVASLIARYPELSSTWQFAMFGGGALEAEVRARIAALGLGDTITLSRVADLTPVFSRSQLFVSTQAYENFTSLAMLEAMAAGSAVIAEDAGQTREFVHHGVNGLLVNDASPEAFADAMAHYMATPELHDRMAAESRRLATEVHTIEHFADDITLFWNEVARER